MKIRSLIAILKEHGANAVYCGPEDAEVYACIPECKDRERQTGFLYFYEELPKAADRSIPQLAADRSVYPLVQELLAAQAQREHALLNLQMEKSQGMTPVRESELCCFVMDNPVCLMRKDFSVIAVSGMQPEEALLDFGKVDRKWLFSLVEAQGLMKLAAEDGRHYRWLIGLLRYKGEKVRLLCVQEKRKFEAGQDGDMMRRLCSVLSNTIQAEAVNGAEERKKRRSRVIGSLLYNRPEHPETVRKLLYDLGFSEREKYYLLITENRDPAKAAGLLQTMQDMFEAEIYSHEEYYVCILHSQKEKEFTGADLQKFSAYLERHEIYGGLSYGFFDITRLSDAMRQAVSALQITKVYRWKYRLGSYSEMVVTDLLRNCAKHDEERLESYIHPSVLRMQAFDAEKGTEYLTFLNVYLISGLSIRRTSEALNIHKNTAYQKLEKLKELFEIDFEDVYLMIKLYISITALTLEGKLDPNEFYLLRP